MNLLKSIQYSLAECILLEGQYSLDDGAHTNDVVSCRSHADIGSGR